MRRLKIIGALMVLAVPAMAQITPALRPAEPPVGSVVYDTDSSGKNNMLDVTRLDDPDVPNVSLYVTHAPASTGWAASLMPDALLQSNPELVQVVAVGPVFLPKDVAVNNDVFRADSTMFSKMFRVARVVDTEKSTITYVIMSHHPGRYGPLYSSRTLHVGNAP